MEPVAPPNDRIRKTSSTGCFPWAVLQNSQQVRVGLWFSYTTHSSAGFGYERLTELKEVSDKDSIYTRGNTPDVLLFALKIRFAETNIIFQYVQTQKHKTPIGILPTLQTDGRNIIKAGAACHSMDHGTQTKQNKKR